MGYTVSSNEEFNEALEKVGIVFRGTVCQSKEELFGKQIKSIEYDEDTEITCIISSDNELLFISTKLEMYDNKVSIEVMDYTEVKDYLRGVDLYTDDQVVNKLENLGICDFTELKTRLMERRHKQQKSLHEIRETREKQELRERMDKYPEEARNYLNKGHF